MSYVHCGKTVGRTGLVLAALLLVAACGHSTQVTSGKDYLSHYPAVADSDSVAAQETAATRETGRDLDAAVRASADVEPLLRFPARIGIARLREGVLTPVSLAEGKAWHDLAGRLGSDWGEIVPISPLIAALASESSLRSEGRSRGQDYRSTLHQTLRDIRLGAARQHVDAVLGYEAFATSEITSNPIAVTKLALIGFFLPSEDVRAKGFAHGVLIDVRNGYTYGMASAQANEDQFALATSANENAVANRLNLQAEDAAVAALAPEVEAMLRDLRLKLAEIRAN
jgi:hypothetical protein